MKQNLFNKIMPHYLFSNLSATIYLSRFLSRFIIFHDKGQIYHSFSITKFWPIDSKQKDLVMVNFMCQFGPQFPQFLIKHYSGVSVRMLLDDISIWVGKLCKEIILTNVDEPHLICWIQQKTEQERILSPFLSLCLMVFQVGHWSSLVFSCLCTQTQTYIISFSVLRLSDCRSWVSIVACTHITNLIIKLSLSSVCVCVCVCVCIHSCLVTKLCLTLWLHGL